MDNSGNDTEKTYEVRIKKKMQDWKDNSIQ